ncbi:MAG: MazG-like family protein, partial [Candidatus Njordarchaeota archaeon]
REDEIDVLVKKPKFIQRISEEMADIFIYLLSLADILGIDLGKSVIEKMKKNEQKYPVERSANDKVKNKIVEQYL